MNQLWKAAGAAAWGAAALGGLQPFLGPEAAEQLHTLCPGAQTVLVGAFPYYAGQAPVTLSLNRHKPVHVAADKPGFLSTEKTFYPEMTTQGAILWGRNNEKSKDFKTDILTIRLKKANSGAPPLRELPAQW